MFFIFCGTVVCFLCGILCVREISTERGLGGKTFDYKTQIGELLVLVNFDLFRHVGLDFWQLHGQDTVIKGRFYFAAVDALW